MKWIIGFLIWWAIGFALIPSDAKKPYWRFSIIFFGLTFNFLCCVMSIALTS